MERRRTCPGASNPATKRSSREGAIKVCILASSSSGNATFIGTARTRLLIDAGISRKRAFDRLRAIGEDPHALDAILVTHEHSDHVASLVTIAKGIEKVRHRKPSIYMTSLTAPTIPWEGYEPELRPFPAGSSFCIGDIDIQSFTIPHDAVDPVGFTLSAGGRKVGLVTDLGYIPDSVTYHVRDTEFLVLESNHDLEMLKVGPYPWQIKQRVMGRKGHLSNDHVGRFIDEALARSVKTLILGHLSEHNNHPELARVTARQALERRDYTTELIVAEPGQQTAVFEFD